MCVRERAKKMLWNNTKQWRIMAENSKHWVRKWSDTSTSSWSTLFHERLHISVDIFVSRFKSCRFFFHSFFSHHDDDHERSLSTTCCHYCSCKRIFLSFLLHAAVINATTVASVGCRFYCWPVHIFKTVCLYSCAK